MKSRVANIIRLYRAIYDCRRLRNEHLYVNVDGGYVRWDWRTDNGYLAYCDARSIICEYPIVNRLLVWFKVI